MPNSKRKKLASEQQAGGICVELRVADVLALRPQWTEAEAAFFLRVCAANLAAAMLRAGTFELACLIKTAEELVAAEGEANAE